MKIKFKRFLPSKLLKRWNGALDSRQVRRREAWDKALNDVNFHNLHLSWHTKTRDDRHYVLRRRNADGTISIGMPRQERRKLAAAYFHGEVRRPRLPKAA